MITVRKLIVFIFVIIVVIICMVDVIIRLDRCTFAKYNCQKKLAVVGRHAILTEMFFVLNEFCNQRGIACIPSFGTLLGFVRDNGRIIEWDDDIDVFVSAGNQFDRLKTLVGEFNCSGNGYRLSFNRPLPWHERFTIRHLNSGLTGDILKVYNRRHFPINTGIVSLANWKEYGNFPEVGLVFPTEPRLIKNNHGTLCTVHFPAKPHVLLRRWYGDNWKTPVCR
jgi:hypothetical protein